MPWTAFLGPLAGIASKIGEGMYDRLEKAHGVRAEVGVGILPGSGSGALILVTVYNRMPNPQRVDGVMLELSEHAGSLTIPVFPPPFRTPPQLITPTDNYVVGFPFDDMKQVVLQKRAQLKNGKVRVVGARVSLASGRVIRASARKVEILKF